MRPLPQRSQALRNISVTSLGRRFFFEFYSAERSDPVHFREVCLDKSATLSVRSLAELNVPTVTCFKSTTSDPSRGNSGWCR